MNNQIDEQELAKDFKNLVEFISILAQESKKINENLHLIYVETALANERLSDKGKKKCSKKDIKQVQNNLESLTSAMDYFAKESHIINEFLLNLEDKFKATSMMDLKPN